LANDARQSDSARRQKRSLAQFYRRSAAVAETEDRFTGYAQSIQIAAIQGTTAIAAAATVAHASQKP
jgi:hypothetical protein